MVFFREDSEHEIIRVRRGAIHEYCHEVRDDEFHEFFKRSSLWNFEPVRDAERYSPAKVVFAECASPVAHESVNGMAS